MTPEEVLDALLQPLGWDTPETAAKQLRLSVATAPEPLAAPVLLTRRAHGHIVRRNSRMIGEHPLQVWARYPDQPDIAFVVTSARGSGVWLDSSYHRADVYTAIQAFDPHGFEYELDAYETADAFGYAVGTPDFLKLVRADGIRWVTP